MASPALRRRAARALERQLDYQRRKAETLRGHEHETMAYMAKRSRTVRSEIEAVHALAENARVLEVGSGAHGLIFFFEAGERIGVDPLAEDYRRLFPAWQDRAQTIAAFGEALPFGEDSFDLVLSDNVVDHAENPRRIVEEMVRVLKPGGALYFTVNIHHPVYDFASRVHSAWRAAGVPFEVTPFADHTVHLTLDSARHLFAGLPVKPLTESNSIAETRRQSRDSEVRHWGDRLKGLFFKNAQWRMIAIKDPELAQWHGRS